MYKCILLEDKEKIMWIYYWEWVRTPAVQSQEKGSAVLYKGANVMEKSLVSTLKVEQLGVLGNRPSWKWLQQTSLKSWYQCTKFQGITSQNTELWHRHENFQLYMLLDRIQLWASVVNQSDWSRSTKSRSHEYQILLEHPVPSSWFSDYRTRLHFQNLKDFPPCPYPIATIHIF